MPLQEAPLSPRQTITVILAGGRGTRLEGLTEQMSKPGLDFGGQFKIIDFALSNCVNSGFRRVMVLTQYSAHRLIEHLQLGWGFLSGRLNEFVHVYPAEQSKDQDAWYQGTADAVYQNLPNIMSFAPRNVLVLAGDHVYRMDYRAFLQDHLATEADLTIACVEVPKEEASGFGIVQVDGQDRIVGFQEKPAAPSTIPGRPDRAFASMGIYLFKAGFLYDQLKRDSRELMSSHDFGKDLIPFAVQAGARVVAHRFAQGSVPNAVGDPYWRDVGTLDAFWEANMDLTRHRPPMDLYDSAWPIFTHMEQLPPAKLIHSELESSGGSYESVVATGCVLESAHVAGALLSSSVHMRPHSRVEQAIVLPDVDIGEGARIRRAVVARGCRIPPGLVVGEDPEKDAKRFFRTRKGITLVTPRLLQQHFA
ncbi:MAG TPA: glucose-1-phosphate adenylyltransferase [Holophagaceae bacterium]|nr:glucose-1-phosphate adenylyltransferase [Holophagaceae bacterium]